MNHTSIQDLGFARVDYQREQRIGVPEIIYGENKTPAEIARILQVMREKNSTALASRISPEKAALLRKEFPDGTYHEQGRIFSLTSPREAKGRGVVGVLTAGTSDLAVAEEAAVVTAHLGNEVQRFYDVGVAGIHRLLAEVPRIQKASVLIVVAGMEGTLPSVVAGLAGKPIVAVPTSIGYGTGLGGLSALLTMLNSCAPGISVVNIDNGVGAAVTAHLINQK